MAGKKQAKKKAGGHVKQGEQTLGQATPEEVRRHMAVNPQVAAPYQEANTPAMISGEEWLRRNVKQAEPTTLSIRLEPGGMVWVSVTHSK
jgi:hypothetical protein